MKTKTLINKLQEREGDAEISASEVEGIMQTDTKNRCLNCGHGPIYLGALCSGECATEYKNKKRGTEPAWMTAQRPG